MLEIGLIPLGEPDVPPSVPHILVGIDDDVVQDLRAIGIELTPDVERELENARREAMAARLLRHAGEISEELMQAEEAHQLELQMIQASHERRIAPLRGRYATLVGFVQTLAELTIEPGAKKKSRSTPWGDFGVTDRKATVQVVDRAAATIYYAGIAPEFVTAKLSLSLAEARERFSDAEIAERGSLDLAWGEVKKTLTPDGTLPPGIETVPATREAFAKPAPIQARHS